MSDLKDYSAQHAANLRARIEQLEAELATYRSGQLVPLPEVEELMGVIATRRALSKFGAKTCADDVAAQGPGA